MWYSGQDVPNLLDLLAQPCLMETPPHICVRIKRAPLYTAKVGVLAVFTPTTLSFRDINFDRRFQELTGEKKGEETKLVDFFHPRDSC